MVGWSVEAVASLAAEPSVGFPVVATTVVGLSVGLRLGTEVVGVSVVGVSVEALVGSIAGIQVVGAIVGDWEDGFTVGSKVDSVGATVLGAVVVLVAVSDGVSVLLVVSPSILSDGDTEDSASSSKYRLPAGGNVGSIVTSAEKE